MIILCSWLNLFFYLPTTFFLLKWKSLETYFLTNFLNGYRISLIVLLTKYWFIYSRYFTFSIGKSTLSYVNIKVWCNSWLFLIRSWLFRCLIDLFCWLYHQWLSEELSLINIITLVFFVSFPLYHHIFSWLDWFDIIHLQVILYLPSITFFCGRILLVLIHFVKHLNYTLLFLIDTF
jgi:hypothetical protein